MTHLSLTPFLIALAALAALAWLARRHGPGQPPPPAPTWLRRRRAIQVTALVVSSLALRAYLVTALDPDRSELWALNAAGGVADAWFRGPLELRHALHPPLHLFAMLGWSELGARLGVGAEIAWIRLPNLALHVLMTLSLLRAGSALAGYSAGFAAATLAAFAPSLVLMSTLSSNYFAEAAVTSWFLAHLALYLTQDRPTWPWLVLSGAAALWIGHLSALVVGPGALLFVVTALRRRQRLPAALSLLAAAALYLPLLQSLRQGLAAYRGATLASQSGVDPETAAAASLAAFGEPALYVSRGFARGEPLALPGALTDTVTGLGPLLSTLLLLAALALVARRHRGLAAVALVATLAFAVTGSLLLMRLPNYAALFPLLLLTLAVGAALLPGPPARATRAPLVLTALALAALYVFVPRPTPDRPFTAFDGWSFYGRELSRLTATAARAPAPVLAMDELKIEWFYALCEDRRSLGALITCLARRGAPEPRGAFELFSVGAATVASPTGARGAGPTDDRCAQLDALLAAPPFAAAPFWLAVSEDYLHYAPSMAGCPERLYGLIDACDRTMRAGDLTLYRCDATVTTPRAPPVHRASP